LKTKLDKYLVFRSLTCFRNGIPAPVFEDYRRRYKPSDTIFHQKLWI